ncbi:MAG: hypothetical protein COB30_005185 [Ectothiorhodospiraceae bacterium]|nr:hypothetical protein [Ectothiorhodospiraceae bacterium]
MLFTFEDSGFALTVSASYQNVVSVGPLVFPIIPFFSDFDGDLYISAEVTAKSPVQLNTGNWTIIDLSNNKSYQAIEQEQLTISTPTRFQVSFPIKAIDITRFKLQIGNITAGQQQITPPPIRLTKTKGTWHFEQFTL